MKILVTGATGFIGQHLVKALMNSGEHEIVTVSRSDNKDIIGDKRIVCDLADTSSNQFELECQNYQPEVIFHLASNAVPNLEGKDPYSMIKDNIISTHRIAEIAPQDCRVVLISSVTVYGDWLFNSHHEKSTKYKEKHFTKPTSIYGMTKRASESIIEIYTKSGKINGCSLRLCATIGEGLTHGIIKDFIAKLQGSNEWLEALGEWPGSTKPFCHVDDAVQAMLLMMNNSHKSRFNVCPDNELSVEEVQNIHHLKMQFLQL